MRNAAANFDDDFDLREPARKKGARRASPGAKKKKGSRRFRFNFDLKRVARYAAIAMSATVAIGIMVNALILQKGHHPAPLFATSIVLDKTKVAAAHPVERAATPEPQAPMPVAKPAAPAAVEPPAAETPSPISGDRIAQLLASGVVPTEHLGPKTVFGIQRALVKLGFGLKPNGTFGPQTKKAMEQFEKSRHLPVNGEPSRRIIKILAAESGLKIEH